MIEESWMITISIILVGCHFFYFTITLDWKVGKSDILKDFRPGIDVLQAIFISITLILVLWKYDSKKLIETAENLWEAISSPILTLTCQFHPFLVTRAKKENFTNGSFNLILSNGTS